jgi:prolipoprotein diacylglyceryltransferase
MILGLTKGQFLSTFMVVVGLAFLVYSLLRGKQIETSEPAARS